MKLYLRPILAALVLGLLGNFMVFQQDDPAEYGTESGWRSLNLPEEQAVASSGLLDRRLGIQVDQDQNRSQAASQTDGATQAFVYDGVTYRLAGLVVGSTPAATLLNEDGTTVRLVPGDTMPDGATVVAIRMNEIELRKSNSATEVVEIY